MSSDEEKENREHNTDKQNSFNKTKKIFENEKLSDTDSNASLTDTEDEETKHSETIENQNNFDKNDNKKDIGTAPKDKTIYNQQEQISSAETKHTDNKKPYALEVHTNDTTTPQKLIVSSHNVVGPISKSRYIRPMKSVSSSSLLYPSLEQKRKTDKTFLNVPSALRYPVYGISLDSNKKDSELSVIRLFLSLLVLIGEIILSVWGYYSPSNRFMNSFLLAIIRLMMIWVSVVFLVWSGYVFLRIFTTSKRLLNFGKFLEFTLLSLEVGLVSFVSMLVFQFIVSIYFLPEMKTVHFRFENLSYLHYWEKITKNFIFLYLEKILTCFSNIINIHLVFNIIVVSIDGNLYFSRYKKKIQAAKPVIKFLKGLNTLNPSLPANNPLSPSEFEEYSSVIYDKLTQGVILNVNHFRYKFGSKDGELFFELFDPDFQKNIIKEAFIIRHRSLVFYSISIHKSISANTLAVENLSFATNLISLIPITYALAEVFSPVTANISSGLLASGMSIAALLIVPLSPVLNDMFYSLFFAFIVRPFDINDIILFENKYSRCLELGIFKSTFLIEGKLKIVQTTSIADQMVGTLENTKYVTFVLNKKFKLNSFGSYYKLKEIIYEYLKFNPDKFRLRHCISYLINEGNFEINIEYSCICRYQELEVANRRSKQFQSKFHETVAEMGMLYA
ncbi:hypothetical protein CDIK_1699 [Cucumispora dikerogammari]|nr:hypothetical protein CDIK_1699 [Cucumispora dikerogammari]